MCEKYMQFVPAYMTQYLQPLIFAIGSQNIILKAFRNYSMYGIRRIGGSSGNWRSGDERGEFQRLDAVESSGGRHVNLALLFRVLLFTAPAQPQRVGWPELGSGNPGYAKLRQLAGVALSAGDEKFIMTFI